MCENHRNIEKKTQDLSTIEKIDGYNEVIQEWTAPEKVIDFVKKAVKIGLDKIQWK